MSSATSVIRRYTPPTCTLEISGKDSPLSRWMGRSALKNIRFKLSFDDPRVGEDRWVTVSGDRIQLQSLCDAVTSYVQKFLHQSSTLVNRAISQNSNTIASPELTTTEPENNFSGIYLEPRGMLSHELHLGTLATEESGNSIPLSAVQLADLATALDEYSADVTALPTLNRSSWASNLPAWEKIAAASLLAIGLSTTALRLFDQPSPSTQTASNQAPPSSSDQRLAVQPLPTSPTPSPLGPLPTTSPAPLASLPTTQVPEAGIAPPPAPQQSPQLKVTEKAPAGSQTPTEEQTQVDIPIAQVPEGSVRVAPIPDQTGGGAPKATRPGATASQAQADPAPPAPEADITAASRANSPAALSEQPSIAADRSAPLDISAFPQVGEVKGFLQKNWQPTAQLKEEAQFRLALAADGTVQMIYPMNESARAYLSELEPLLKNGTKVASATKDGRPSILQIFLNPSGKVEVMQPQQ